MELTEARPKHQRAAIEAWLSCHEPPPLLEVGLRREGFLPLEEETPV